MKKSKHVMISGAGSGLGLGMALRYLKRGAWVSVLDLRVCDLSREMLDEAAALGNGQWHFFQENVTDLQGLTDTVQLAGSLFGPIDLAINSAGIVLNKTVAEMEQDDFSRVIDVNLKGSFNFAFAVLPKMNRGSRIALVASLAGLTSNYAYSAYGASKFGVVGLATTLRYEYEVQGINVSCISPPEVNTPLVEGERLHANPVSMALKKIAGSMNVDDACNQIVDGLDAGRWMIIPGNSGKATAWAARHMPSAFHGFMTIMIRRTMRRFSMQAAS